LAPLEGQLSGERIASYAAKNNEARYQAGLGAS